MKLFKYSEYITESKLELLLEANMQFSTDFLVVVANVKNPIAEKILKLYTTEVDVDTNYIDLSDKENFVQFKSDKRVETACVIKDPGEIYDVLSKNLFPSSAEIYIIGTDEFRKYISENVKSPDAEIANVLIETAVPRLIDTLETTLTSLPALFSKWGCCKR